MPVRKPSARRRSLLRFENLEPRDLPSFSIGQNFAGGNINDSGFIPPDTDGAVGPNNYVQFINGVYRVYDKAGTQLLTETDSTFWSNVSGVGGGVVAGGVSDPRIIYDPLTDRWIASEITVDNTNSILVARSSTNNPAGAWKGVHWQADLDGNFGDYDTLAVDANGVYLGTNDFSNSTGGLVSVSVDSLPKADLMANTPTAVNRSQFQQTGAEVGYTPRGVTNFSPNPAHASIFAEDISTFGQVNRTLLTGTGAAGATLGTPTNLSVQTWAATNNSHQPDGTADVDSVDDRFGGMVYQVGDLIIGAHAVGVGSRNAVRITVMSDAQNAVVAEATISSSTFDYIDPSVAMNAEGDILIGYTRSAATLGSGASDGRLGAYATTAYINPNNPGAGITFGNTDIQLQTGGASNYHVTFGGPSNRWGDYSATQVDPVNSSAFWTTQEYAINASTWGTKISQVFVPPRVSLSAGVSSTAADGTYTTGQVIPITVTFNDAVSVTGGTPTLTLNDGAVATYASGSGSNVLTFNYTVAHGDTASRLDYASTSALNLNGASIKDVASGLAAILTLATPGTTGSLGANKNIVIDTTPRVTGGVTSTLANGTYGVGTVVPVTVTFSSPVHVTGQPKLALNASGTAAALYASGDNTATLTFNYTVAAGDVSPDLDYTSTTALTLNGGTITDSTNSGLNAVLTLPAPGAAGSLGANKNIVIDATVANVSGVSSTAANGSYGFGQTIPITVTFTKAVVVAGGTPTLALNDGGVASYASGSPGATLTFNYTVASGDFTPLLDYASTSALALNGATITQQSNGAAATLALPAPGAAGSLGANKSIAVDARPATPNGVTTTTPNGSYGFGTVIPIKVTFDKPVDVTGSPTLALNSTGTATYQGGSATNVTSLTFTFTVGVGDLSAHLDYSSASALTLSGGTIKDHASGAAATLTLPAPGAAGSLGANSTIAVDGTPGHPSNVTSTLANGTYVAGAVIPITITFSKPVDVTGAPVLALNSGGTAVYTGGNATNVTSLAFTYTVASGDNSPDLDELSAAALNLPAGGDTITDHVSGAAATLTLPAPGAAGSLGANKNLIVRTSAGLSFSLADFSTAEGATGGVATITVQRLFDSVGAVSVDYATSDGTANAGSDYTATSGTLTWLTGDSTDKTFTVPITVDNLSEGKETIHLTLTNATGNAAVGPQDTATLTIAPSNGITINGTDKVAKSTFTDADGDLVTLSLGGKTGTLTYYLTNGVPTGGSFKNGNGPIAEIDLAGTDPTKSTVMVSVKKPKGGTGDGRVNLGEVDGTGFKGFTAKVSDLVGAGFNLGGYAGSIKVGNVLNGADFELAGALPAKATGTKITAGVIADGTDINVTAPLAGLTAIAVGKGTIEAPAVGTIKVTGRKANPAKGVTAVSGDFLSSLTASGVGVNPVTGKALKLLSVAGSVSGSTMTVGGNVGTVSVGSFVGSQLYVGYNTGTGKFTDFFSVGPFVTHAAAHSFANSDVYSASFKSVTLASVDTVNATAFGFHFDGAGGGTFGGLTAKAPKLAYNKTAGGTQTLKDEFEVEKL